MLLLGVCDAPRSRTAGISSATPAAPATGSSATGSAATRSAATRSAATGSAATGSSATGSAAAGCARLVLSRSRISSGSRGSSQRSTPSHPDGQTEAGCSRRTNMATVALDDAPTSAPAPSTTSSPASSPASSPTSGVRLVSSARIDLRAPLTERMSWRYAGLAHATVQRASTAQWRRGALLGLERIAATRASAPLARRKEEHASQPTRPIRPIRQRGTLPYPEETRMEQSEAAVQERTAREG